MLRIVLMRHAKSSWKSDAPTDHERPLNRRGREAAPKVGAKLRALRWVPDVVLSSDATRTHETFVRMREALGVEADVARFSRALYHEGAEAVRDVLSDLADDVETVLLLGHNPGWEEALEWLTGEDEELKTGCAALLSRDDAPTWATAASPGWRLHDVLRPREL